MSKNLPIPCQNNNKSLSLFEEENKHQTKTLSTTPRRLEDASQPLQYVTKSTTFIHLII